MPLSDDASLFGLPSEADTARRKHNTHNLFTLALTLQPHVGEAAPADVTDAQVFATANEALSRLPELLPAITVASAAEQARPQAASRSGRMRQRKSAVDVKATAVAADGSAAAEAPDPLHTVLVHETARYNVLLSTVGDTLRRLCRAVRGLVEMSEELELAYGAVLSNKVPEAWEDVGFR